MGIPRVCDHTAAIPRSSFAMHCGISSIARSMSAVVVKRESESRIEPCATSGGMPIAKRTGDGSRLPDEHAAPALAQMPRSDRSIRIASASRRRKPMFVVFHSRCGELPSTCPFRSTVLLFSQPPNPLTVAMSQHARISRSRRSRSALRTMSPPPRPDHRCESRCRSAANASRPA